MATSTRRPIACSSWSFPLSFVWDPVWAHVRMSSTIVCTLLAIFNHWSAVAFCRTLISPWQLLPVWNNEKTTRCVHVMWSGQPLTGSIELRCPFEITHCQRDSPTAGCPDVSASASLSPSAAGSVGYSKLYLLPSLYESLSCERLVQLISESSKIFWLWCCNFHIHSTCRPICRPVYRCEASGAGKITPLTR